MTTRRIPGRLLAVAFCLVWAPLLQGQKLCFWKVAGESNTVYLLGSIHFLKEDFYPLPKPIESAFEQAQTVVFETDLGQMEDPQTQMKMLMMGACPPGKTLRDFVSEETYGLLKEHLGAQTAVFDRFKPWFAAVALVALEIQKLGFNPEQGVDRHYYKRALKAGKKTAGLETVEFQMDLFKNLSDKDQEQFLNESIKETGQIRTMFTDITAAWSSGDVAKLEAQLLAAMKEYPDLEKKFMTERNHAWVPQIEQYLKQTEPVLFVVGAGHLVGRESVVELLRKRGFKVEQQENK